MDISSIMNLRYNAAITKSSVAIPESNNTTVATSQKANKQGTVRISERAMYALANGSATNNEKDWWSLSKKQHANSGNTKIKNGVRDAEFIPLKTAAEQGLKDIQAKINNVLSGLGIEPNVNIPISVQGGRVSVDIADPGLKNKIEHELNQLKDPETGMSLADEFELQGSLASADAGLMQRMHDNERLESMGYDMRKNSITRNYWYDNVLEFVSGELTQNLLPRFDLGSTEIMANDELKALYESKQSEKVAEYSQTIRF